MKKHIEFSLVPYKNEFFDNSIRKRARNRVKQFYRKFYLRPSYIFRKGVKHLKAPAELATNFYKMISYQIGSSQKSRNDYV